MHRNKSPWIGELDPHRPPYDFPFEPEYDTGIIGAGIAGIVTAYYILTTTNHSLILLEGERIGQGATGHNAGQVVDYFEKPFTEIVQDYGLDMAVAGQQAVTSAWDLLDEILKKTNINIPFAKFIGYAGCTSYDQLKVHLDNKLLKQKGGVHVERVLIAEEFLIEHPLSPEYSELYYVAPQFEVLRLLETDNQNYIAALRSQKGTLNSALFVEKLASYLLEHYKERFVIQEHCHVREVHLYEAYAELVSKKEVVKVNNVVLCTNGFENFHIINHGGSPIDTEFHDQVTGVVGYMAGYVDPKPRDPVAISYFTEEHTGAEEEPYIYLTRRAVKGPTQEYNLICIGGPEETYEDTTLYSKESIYPRNAEQYISGFFQNTFKHVPPPPIEYAFKWHGLMGYTRSLIRCVGYDRINPVLLYNLGCNGVGILPSIYGGKKISLHLAGEKLPSSIFDPVVQANLHLRGVTGAQVKVAPAG